MTTGHFKAVYHVEGTKDSISSQVEDITVEQTVEFPVDLIERQDILDEIVGRVVSVDPIDEGLFEAFIEYPVETAGDELPQLLNVLFGNISIKPGIRLSRFELTEELYAKFKGPRFGRKGLRDLLNAHDRPLVCSAIKPMGLSPRELAQLAYKFALGGIDMIKDDHGLSDQTFCPFDERVERCSEAVAKASKQTGKKCLYFPNITAPIEQVRGRAYKAKNSEAGGLVISPGLVGFDAMRMVASDDNLALPILFHPALTGSFTVGSSSGMSHGVLYGQISRLAGADAAIFPSFGGRFSLSEEECMDVTGGTECPMGHIKASFPVPAGGMSTSRIPELIDFYGKDVILLVGGDLHRHGPDLTQNCREFVKLVAGE